MTTWPPAGVDYLQGYLIGRPMPLESLLSGLTVQEGQDASVVALPADRGPKRLPVPRRGQPLSFFVTDETKGPQVEQVQALLASGTTKYLASAGLFFASAVVDFSPSWKTAVQLKATSHSSAAFFIYRPDQIADNRKPARRLVSLLSLCSPWKRLGSQDGAREGMNS